MLLLMKKYSRFLILSFLILITSCAELSFAEDVNTVIPKNAFNYLPMVKEETNKLFSEFKEPYYFGSLIEHESCLSLTHSRCWSPTSRLKTKREEGAGLGQLTKAYHSDGSIRFDALTELSKKHSTYLKELSWSNVYQRPDLQIKSIILLYKDSYKTLYSIKDETNRMRFTDAAYNGGVGGVYKDRRLCSLKEKCDPQIWFNNVELTCSKSKKILYGNRNACDINRHHVYDVTVTRLPKYKLWFENN